MNAGRDDVDGLIGLAFGQGGSDVLLTFGSVPMVRVNGELCAAEGYRAYSDEDLRDMILGLLSPAERRTFAELRQVDFSFGWRGWARLRGNAFVQRGHPALALRIVADRVPTVEQIAVPSQVCELMRLPQGLVLVTGPTGSGKSTTQAALIDFVSRERAVHVLTLEDPIEYVHGHGRGVVSQREVG